MADAFPDGTVHIAPDDVVATVGADPAALDGWRDLTPLARNEYLCWIADARQAATRSRRIARMTADLVAGKRRSCCWPGCPHRSDKPPSRWQQAMAARGTPRP